MYLSAYTLLDVKTGIYHPPYFFHNDGDATRSVLNASTPGTSLYQNPEDFVLYAIGGFDGNTGMMHPGEIRNLGSLAALAASASRVTLAPPSSEA